MSHIDNMKIRRLDTAILLIFLSLMRHRKGTVTAAELGLTQSTVSHALRRLRDVFEDQLFLRKPHGFEPTAYAQRIEPMVQAAVDALRSAVAGGHQFNPRTAQVRFRLAALDHTISTLFADLIANCRTECPGARFSVRSLGRQASLDALRLGEIDAAVGYYWDLPAEIESCALGPEGYKVVARRGHPKLQNGVDLETYCACSHVVVSTDGSLWGVADRALAAIGAQRDLAAAVPHFLPSLAIVSRSDFLALLPASMVENFAPQFDLDIYPVPFSIRSFDISVIWHRRDLRRPELEWLVGHIQTVAKANLAGEG